ncbi:MAG: HEAT repeat domain-containing protein, partial [Cyanobacteria bacterium J06627_8]
MICTGKGSFHFRKKIIKVSFLVVAAIALGNLGNPEVLPALQQTLDDPDRDVQIFSQRAIQKIQDQTAEPSNA